MSTRNNSSATLHTGGNAKSGPIDDNPEGIKNYYQATVLFAMPKRFMVRFLSFFICLYIFKTVIIYWVGQDQSKKIPMTHPLTVDCIYP